MKISFRQLSIVLTALLSWPMAMAASPRPVDTDVAAGFSAQLQTVHSSLHNLSTPPPVLATLPQQGILQAKPSSFTDEAALRLSRPSHISSISELSGEHVMTVRSLLSSSFGDDGNACQFTPINGTDSVRITGFWNNACSLTAHVDIASGVITIPNQVVGQMVDNGNIDIAFCNTNGTPDRSKKITGRILADGTVILDDWWGIYVVAGTNKDRYAFVGYETYIRKANGTMTFNFLNGETVEFGVYITQPYDNRILITNFGNYGMTVYVDLDTQRGGTIPSQTARQYPANGSNFFTCAIGAYDAAGNPTGITGTIRLTPAPAGNNSTLSWGKWTAISQGTQNMFFGAILDGKITYDGTFTYPAPVTGFLDGEGTAESPYLVRTRNDLIRIAQGVNSVPASQYNAFLNGVDCATVYEGKHFRLENDIDLGAHLFTPIGADAYHYFAGTFDGNNHTILNLNISSTTGLAALFGLVSHEGTVKNLKLTNPTVQCNAQTAGTICGWNFGTIDNCHVTGANVTNYARIAGGLVGVGHVVTNCSVKDSYILGSNGNPGGMAGQVDSLMTNCHVTNTTVVGASGSSGLPAGGVVAALTNARGSNLTFSGIVDTRTYMCTMSAGGVVGVLSNAILDQSFATGEVKSAGTDNYGNKAAAGGVVGKTYGSVIENCYFTGNVSTYTNRCTGGITGWLTPDIEGTDTTYTTIRNCYTASMVASETYLYDKEKEARETIGWVESGSPTLQNLYFDNQLTNLNSTRFGTTTAVLTSAAGPAGFDASVWQFTAGQYPRLKVSASLPAALHSASAIILPERSSLKKISGDADLNALEGASYALLLNGVPGNQGHYCSIDGKKLKITEDFGTDTIRMTIGSLSYDREVRIAPISFDGDGTQNNPFLIKTKEDMLQLGHITTDIQQTFPGDYFLMTNDIDMANDTTFKGICSMDGTAGTYNKFAGVFDGGGHRILNLNMELMVWTTPPNEATGEQGTPNSSKCDGVNGIFGRLAPEGIIRNLIVDASSSFTFWSRSGAIVGQNEGLVENCRNHAMVRCASGYAGGIVGENRKGVVRRCYNDGLIYTGSSGAGGIVATGNGRVEECVNAGTVKAMLWTKFVTNSKSIYRVGGIQGENQGTDFYDCVNFGYVEGYKEVGGIAAMLAEITSTSVLGTNEVHRVLSLGRLSTQDEATIGMIGGTAGTRGAVEYAHWDRQLFIHEAHGGAGLQGSKGISTAMLTSGNAIEGFSPEIWDFAKGKYPVPAWCADEPMLQHARSLVITIPEEHTSYNFHGTAILAGLDGHQWTLSEDAPYTLSGNTLSAPSSITQKLSAQLTGKSGGYVRIIDLASNLPVPLQGNGTQDSPYLITNADDWNALADYITATKETFADKYLKVSGDFSFDGKNFKPLFINTDMLMGVIDGAGYTISGITYTTVNSYEAAIGTIGVNGLVRNLKLQGNISTTVANTGGFSARVYGIVENCENQMNVTATKGAGHSGFGYIYYSAQLKGVANRADITGANGQLGGIAHNVQEGARFEQCVNYGTVKSTSTATSCNNFGGLVATCYPATFINCHNEGKFEFNKPDGSNQVGGIIGNATSSAAPRQAMILTNCYNLTDITANNILGGLVANVANNNCSLALTGCYNRGNIESVATKSTSNAPTAGLSAFAPIGSTFRACYNYGNITSAKNVYAAGIAAQYKSTGQEAKPILIVDCHNSGNIAANGNQGGGIMAIGTAWLTIDSCSNTGNVTGGFGLAGIMGQFNSANQRIAHCYNTGDITSTGRYVGGITGWGNIENAVIEDCFNIGDISSTSSAGGVTNTSGAQVGGISGYTGATLRRCYNMGSVIGVSQVGGICGAVFKNRTKLYDCINAGEVVAPLDTCGSLIGMNVRSGANWNTLNVLENCYYLTPDEPLGNDVLGQSLSLDQLTRLDMGEEWIKGDDYTLPLLRNLNNEVARLYAACVILGVGDFDNRVTQNFHVGCPDGVVWSVNVPDNVHFHGTLANFTLESYMGPLVLTATLGERHRTFNMRADYLGSVDGMDADGAVVVKEEWYTTDGKRVVRPAIGQSGIYIVVRHFNNGMRKSEKVTVK